MAEHHHDHKHEQTSCHCHDHHEHGHHEHEHDHHEHDHHEHEHHRHEQDCGCGCGCGHDHEHGHEEGKPGLLWLRYGLGALPILMAFLPMLSPLFRIASAALGYLLFGFEVWRGMLRGFLKKKLFTEFTLMCVATVCAFAIGEYADGAAVMYLYSLGETLSGMAYSRSKRNLSELFEITPEYASVQRGEGFARVHPKEVLAGEVILVLAGERVPLDGRVIEGGGSADASSITGESKPLELYEGVICPSGAILRDGSVQLCVLADYENSVVFRLAEAVEQASAKRSAAEKRITRFAGIFTPLAFAVAALVWLIGWALSGELIPWLRAAAMVLVVSCPCSLVLSVPLTYFAGAGSAAKQGMVFRGGEVMDRLSRVGAVCFDKTGTLTEASLSFDGVELYGETDRQAFLSLAHDVLTYSPHPAARSFVEAVSLDPVHTVEQAENLGGRGVICLCDGKRTYFGNAALMREQGIAVEDSKTTAIFGGREGVLLGKLNFSSHLKAGVPQLVGELRQTGVTRIAVLSGDGAEAVAESCRLCGIEEYSAGMSPDQKAARFAQIADEQRQDRARPYTAYCGDGLNDSAVIAGADVGIAMGGCGSALTVSSADLCLMDDQPVRIVEAIRLAKRTARIATQNIALSLGIKLAVLLFGVLLALLGRSVPMGLAVVADVGAALLAVLNALRAAKK